MTDEYEAPPKLQVIPASNPSSATFVVSDEDHTLGNSLRYMLMRSPETQFCGYSVPHPSEALINVRLQTKGAPAVDVFRAGLQGLIDVTTHIESTFIRACTSSGPGGASTITEADMDGASGAVVAALAATQAGGGGRGGARKGDTMDVEEEVADKARGAAKKKEKKGK